MAVTLKVSDDTCHKHRHTHTHTHREVVNQIRQEANGEVLLLEG